jgi:hypothetical protein
MAARSRPRSVPGLASPATLGAVALLLAISHGWASAQATFPEENAKALAGVRAFDAKAAVFTWLNMPEDRARFLNQADSVFHLGITRAGATVDRAAPNYLFCELWVAEASGLVAYAWNVSYYVHELAGVHRLEWRQGGMVTVGRNNFTPQSSATVCVDAFTAEWRRRNP